MAMDPTAPILCRDRFIGYPKSILPGRDCDHPAPFPGAACFHHADEFYALLNTPISDVPDEREVRQHREAQAMDPAVVARIAEARAYLTDCAARTASDDDLTVHPVPSFCRDLIADRKYGTAYFRITEKMADALIRTRDGEKARATRPEQPRADEALRWVIDNAPADTFAASLLAGIRRFGGLTTGQYTAVLRNIDRGPRQDPATGAGVTTDGWYKAGEDIFKVQVAVHGSGKLYAKRLMVTGHGEATWEYAPGMVYRLTDADRLSIEDAAKFGTLYGVCAVCGRTLTDEESIEAGIGPVCIKRLG